MVKTRFSPEQKIANGFELLNKKEKKIQIDINNEGVDFLEGHEDKFERLFDNLFSNSVDHGFHDLEGGTIFVRLASFNNGTAVRIKYWNDGLPLSRDRCDTIFISKYRNDKEHSGLGLSGAKDMVEGMGASLSALTRKMPVLCSQ
jgi:signal transduction histidine kinase